MLREANPVCGTVSYRKTAALALLFIGRSVVFGKTQMKRAAGYDPDEESALPGHTMSDSVAKSAIAAAPERRTWVGVIIALAAAAAFALANTSASVAYHGGSNALTVAATRFIVPAAALVVWTRISGIPLRLAKRDALAAASLGVVTALYNWAILRAFSSIPLLWQY